MGIARAALDRRLQQYAQRVELLTNQVQTLTEQLARAEGQRVRLETAYHTVAVLREKLAKERSTNAVLVARVIQHQPILPPQYAKEERKPQVRFKKEQISPELQAEHEALHELIEVFHRAESARNRAVSGLAIRSILPGSPTRPSAAAAQQAAGQQLPAPPGSTRSAAPEALPPLGDKWHYFVVGKRVGKDLKSSDGRVLARDGEEITPELLKTVGEAGLTADLLLRMRLPYPQDDG